MSVLSNLPVMPNRIAIACEYLYFLGSDGGDTDSIIKQLSPLKPETELKLETEEKLTGSTIASAVISEMEKLKLLVTSEGSLKLTDEIRILAPKSGDWHEILRPLLCERMTSPDLVGLYEQNELPEALAWLIGQDPLNPPSRSGGLHVELISQQLGEADSLRTSIGNDSRYQNLLYWARYFGFVEWLTFNSINVVIPDPTSAILRELPKIFGANKVELPFNIFIQRLGEIYPVLDGGRARVELEARLNNSFQRQDHQLLRSTSLSLKRLELRRIIEMSSDSDAEAWVLDLGNEMPVVSRIKFNGGALV